MSEDKKPVIQETLSAIARATDMDSLVEAISKVDDHTKAEQVELVDIIEKRVLRDFGGKDHVNARVLGVLDVVLTFSGVVAGNHALDSLMGDNNFEFHSILTEADLVVKIKGDKAAPELKELIEEVAKLSDEDYNSATSLARVFINVARKQAMPARDNKVKNSNKPNPFRR